MQFTVDTRDTLVLLTLRKASKRQAYAIAGAISTTLLAIQASVPAHLQRQHFIVRKRDFFFGGGGRRGGVANKITGFPRAVTGNLVGRIAVQAGSLASQRRLLLSQFESGGMRRPMTAGAKSVAVPILGRPARPSLAQGVRPEFSFQGMRLQAYRGGRKLTRRQRGRHTRDVSTFGEYGRLSLPDASTSLQWKGRNRTFEIPQLASGQPGGVFQRIGRGRGAIREIWAFVRAPQLEANLKFVANAQQVTDRTFRTALLTEVRKTLDFHGAGGGA